MVFLEGRLLGGVVAEGKEGLAVGICEQGSGPARAGLPLRLAVWVGVRLA